MTVESHITSDGELLICVRDNGIGFDSERLKQIRDKIENDTVKALRSGSHIGLANVHARIKLRSAKEGHGVSIDSSPETGTTVSVRMQALYEEGESEWYEK